MSGWMTVAVKEIRDHGRDRRSLMSAALYSFMGPVVILLVAQSSAASRRRSAAAQHDVGVRAGFRIHRGHVPRTRRYRGRARARFASAALAQSDTASPSGRGEVDRSRRIRVAGLVLNLVGFTAVFEWSRITPPNGTTWPFVLWVVCGLVPLALLGAALHILTGTASRTLKDAQARLSIVTLVPMMTGMFLVFFPDTIGRWWFAMPVIGQQALFGEALRGHTVSLLQAGMLALLTLGATTAGC